MNLLAPKVGVFSVLLLACVSARAQQVPASPADTDPAKMGWMPGSPPPLEGRIRYKCQWRISNNARGVHGQTIYIDPKAANANYDDISLPAYQAIAERLLKGK